MSNYTQQNAEIWPGKMKMTSEKREFRDRTIENLSVKRVGLAWEFVCPWDIGTWGHTHLCAFALFFSTFAKSETARPVDIRSTPFHSICEHGSPASSSCSGVRKVLYRELVDPRWSASIAIPASQAGQPLSLLSYVCGASSSQRRRDELPQWSSWGSSTNRDSPAQIE